MSESDVAAAVAADIDLANYRKNTFDKVIDEMYLKLGNAEMAWRKIGPAYTAKADYIKKMRESLILFMPYDQCTAS